MISAALAPVEQLRQASSTELETVAQRPHRVHHSEQWRMAGSFDERWHYLLSTCGGGNHRYKACSKGYRRVDTFESVGRESPAVAHDTSLDYP